MLRIGTGAEHRCEAMTGAVADLFAELFRDRNVGQPNRAAIRQRERAQVNRVAFAMLAQLRASDTVAATALEIVVGLDRAQRGAEFVDAWRYFIAQPGGD